jgi:hypothetical protein
MTDAVHELLDKSERNKRENSKYIDFMITGNR